MTESTLHLIRLALDRRELSRVGARHHLPSGVDEGYLIHAGLSQLFAHSSDKAEIPLHSFVVDPQVGHDDSATLMLLAYSDCDEADLQDRMVSEHRQLVRHCASRPMPTLQTGTRAGYRLRACPIVRTRRPGLGEDAERQGKRRKSRELDAWLAHRLPEWSAEPPPGESAPFERSGAEWTERQEVYGAWLARELERDGAASMEEAARMESFQRALVYRRGRGKGHRMTRPDVVLEGMLMVQDEGSFRTLLRRGIGRHRAFGFGMLLLRAP